MEIKVGECVRTDKGIIGKVIGIFDYHCAAKYHIEFQGNVRVKRQYLSTKTILKHSKNIIDLIEVGDYVNGYKVSFKDNDYKSFVQCDYPVQEGTTNHYKFYEEAIKSIVTHQSFKQVEYEV